MSSDFDPYRTWLGIPPEDQPPNHYRLLGIAPFEDQATAIEHAADRQMAHLRTLQTGKHPALSQRLLNEVATARVCLLNTEKKAAYDRQLRETMESPSVDEREVTFSPAPVVTEKRAPAHEPSSPDGSEEEEAVRTKLPLVLGAVGAGVLLLVGLIYAGSWLTAGPPPEAVLIFNWPAEARRETKLSIDDKWSTVPESKGPIEHSCKPGEHRIVAERQGFKRWETVVQLAPGDRRKISPSWKRQAYLVLQWPTSERQNAKVAIDGKQPDISTLVPRPGPTGMKLPLEAGEHVVRIIRQGFEPFEQTVTIAQDKDVGLRPVWKKLSDQAELPELPELATAPVMPTPKEELPVRSDDTQWISLLRSPSDLVGWEVPGKSVKCADGVVELDSTHMYYPPVVAKDMVIRAKVKKLEGKTAVLVLRYTASGGFYAAYFNDKNYFGIGRGMGKSVPAPVEKFEKLKDVHGSKPYNGPFEMEFAAIGDTLTLRVDGQEIIRLRDQTHDSGTFCIEANEGRAEFSQVQARILDKDWTPPPGLAATPEPGTKEMPKGELPSPKDGQWIPLLRSPAELVDWKVSNKGVKFSDGVVELDSVYMHYTPVVAKDMVIRAKVKQLDGDHLALYVRRNGSDALYSASFKGGNHFAIEKLVAGQDWREIKAVNTGRPYNDFFEMEFAAIGDTLTLSVDGQEIIRLLDQSISSGTFGIGAWSGRAQFSQVEVRVLDKDWTPPPGLVATPKPEPKETPAELDPALKLRQKLDAKFAGAVEPVEAMVSAWDFSAAVAALAKIKFDEPELTARRNARGRELQRLVKFKTRIIAKINAADPPLKKSSLKIRGMNGVIVKADEQSITTELSGGKSEAFTWHKLGQKASERLVQMVIDRQKSDDWLTAGLLALVLADATSAEKHFEKARSLGADIGPHLAPLAAAALGRVNVLLEKKEFAQAKTLLDEIKKKYANTPWFAANTGAFEAACKAAAGGSVEGEAEKLYAQAAKLFKEDEPFDLRPLVEKLKADYADSPAVTDADRQPSFGQMALAVAELGALITVRLDGKGDHKSVQEAIDAAEPKCLIEIHDNGPYNEKLVIPKEKTGLTIRGKKGFWPVITSLGPTRDYETLVLVLASGVTLERLVLVHGTPSGDHCRCVGICASQFRIRSAVSYMSIKGKLFDTWHTNSVPEVRGCLLLSSMDIHVRLSFADCFFLSKNATFRSPCELRRCTILGSVSLNRPPSVLADCVVNQIYLNEKGHRVDHCDLFGRPPVKGREARELGINFGATCFTADPQFADPRSLDFRLKPTSPCRGKASDGGDLGATYTPEMLEMIKAAFALRQQGVIKF